MPIDLGLDKSRSVEVSGVADARSTLRLYRDPNPPEASSNCLEAAGVQPSSEDLATCTAQIRLKIG
jgi:hypothetical protein